MDGKDGKDGMDGMNGMNGMDAPRNQSLGTDRVGVWQHPAGLERRAGPGACQVAELLRRWQCETRCRFWVSAAH